MKKFLLLTLLFSFVSLSSCSLIKQNDSQENQNNEQIEPKDNIEPELSEEEQVKQWKELGYICKDNLVFQKNKDEYIVYSYYGKPVELVIPDLFKKLPVTKIWLGFSDCYTLKKVTIGKNVYYIGDHIFTNCTSLEQIIIDENNEHIFFDNGLLYCENQGYTSLVYCPYNVNEEITLLEETSYICKGAFSIHPKIKTLNLSVRVNNINPSTNLKDLFELNEITISSDNEFYSADDGVLFNKDKSELVFVSPTRHTDYIIPSTVTSLYGSVFEYCTKLKSITVNAQLNPENYFVNYQLYCPFVENYYVDGNSQYLVSSGGILYSRDLKKLFGVPPRQNNPQLNNSIETICKNAFNWNVSQSLVIPDSVKYIDDYAFFAGLFNLNDITMAKNIISIGSHAFYGTDNLKTIYFKGNQEDFSKIEILDNNDFFLSSQVIYI